MPLSKEDNEIIDGLNSTNPKVVKQTEDKVYEEFVKIVVGFNYPHKTDENFDEIYCIAIQDFFRSIRKGAYKGQSSLRTFFSAIFRNKTIDYFRTENKHGLDDDEYQAVFGPPVVYPDYRGIDIEGLLEVSNQVNSNCKNLITLKLVEGYKYKEIVEKLNLGYEQVRNSLRKCLKTFKSLWKNL